MAASAARVRRAYDMERRSLAAAGTRAAIIQAVHTLLDAPHSSTLTVEEVARAAGVTRVTVYNQFGSRRALLAAAFADQGRLVRYDRVTAAAALVEPRAALGAALREVCRAWDTIPRAIQRVLALAVLDPEIGAVVERYERGRRAQMAALAKRLDAPVGDAAAAALLGALTSPLTYYQLRAGTGAAIAARRLEHVVMTALGFTHRRK